MSPKVYEELLSLSNYFSITPNAILCCQDTNPCPCMSLIVSRIVRSVLLRLENGIKDIQGQISNDQALHQIRDNAHNQLFLQNQNDIQRSMSNIMGAQNRLQLKVDLLEAMHVARAAEAATENTSEGPRCTQNLQLGTRPVQPIKLSAPVYSSSCAIECKCLCHVRTKVSYRALNLFLGSLFVGYNGIPFITPKCDDPHCRQRADLVTLITYVFPPWLLARALCIALKWSPHIGPELNIRVARVVSETSAIFSRATLGDVEGVKTLLSARLCSPYDEDVSRGDTGLMVG